MQPASYTDHPGPWRLTWHRELASLNTRFLRLRRVFRSNTCTSGCSPFSATARKRREGHTAIEVKPSRFSEVPGSEGLGWEGE